MNIIRLAEREMKLSGQIHKLITLRPKKVYGFASVSKLNLKSGGVLWSCLSLPVLVKNFVKVQQKRRMSNSQFTKYDLNWSDVESARSWGSCGHGEKAKNSLDL